MKNSDKIKDIVVDRFSEKGAQERYRKLTLEGLLPCEEELYRKYFKKGSSIIDIGCGSGRTTFPLKKLGYEVVGVDLTPAMIDTARSLAEELHMDVRFEIGDATTLKFKDSSFDNGIFSFCGWDQIPGTANRLKALHEASRVLKKGGYFIFSSHIRVPGRWGRWIPFWAKQWLKLYLLKPLGFRVLEEEWGDRFFNKETDLGYSKPQYTHIPSLRKVKDQLKEAGFFLEFYENKYNLESSGKKRNTGHYVFFVCRKE